MDPIADMLTNLRNCQKVGKPAVLPWSTLKIRILEILKTQGYVARYAISKTPRQTITVGLTEKSLQNVKRISKPGRRLYAKAKQLRPPQGSLLVVSTPVGVLTAQAARKRNVGGELLFEVKP